MANGCPALLSALQQPTFAGAAVFDWLLAIVAASPVLLATLLAALCHRRSAPAPPACLIVARVLSIALLAVGAIGVLAHGIPRTVLTCLVASELGAVGLVLSEAGYWSLRFRQLTERNGLLPHLPPWLRELLTRTTWLEFLTARQRNVECECDRMCVQAGARSVLSLSVSLTCPCHCHLHFY